MNLEAITTVYSYRFPEVRKIITELTNPFPHEIFLKSVQPPGALDNIHESVIDKILDFYKDSIPDLTQFKFRYPTSGSEEGIREVMSMLQQQNVKQIYTFKGEYEGFKDVAKTRGINLFELDIDTNPKNVKPGYFFISNPSARDGNILPNSIINNICDAGHMVFYDFAYLGSTKKHEFTLNHENIFAAVLSFSKPYGLFYDRIGFTFSRKEVPSLYGNKWFKSILGLMIAEKIVTTLKPYELYLKYKPTQERIVDEINDELHLRIQPSDALLLGYLSEKNILALESQQLNSISKFKRDNVYRFCLTPYYLKHEQRWEHGIGAANKISLYES